jgi:uncharacterized protein DUF6879
MLVRSSQLDGFTLPAGDFWIFDSKYVLQWEYEKGRGKLIGGKVWNKDEGDNITEFLKLKDALLAIARPVR